MSIDTLAELLELAAKVIRRIDLESEKDPERWEDIKKEFNDVKRRLDNA